jgi:hypothetical protein
VRVHNNNRRGLIDSGMFTRETTKKHKDKKIKSGFLFFAPYEGRFVFFAPYDYESHVFVPYEGGLHLIGKGTAQYVQKILS